MTIRSNFWTAGSAGQLGARCLIAGLLGASLLPAQLEQAKTTLQRVLANPQADLEVRSMLLAKAHRLAKVAKGPKREKSKLLDTIKKHIKEIDPGVLDRMKARRKTAKALLKSAKSYQQAGWNRMASQLLDTALELDPHIDKEAASALRDNLRGDNRLLHETFDAAMYPYGGDRWNLTNHWIASPRLALDAGGETLSTMIQAPDTLHGDYKFSMEVLMGNQPGTIGLALGMTGRAEKFHMIQLEYADMDATLSVHSYEQGLFLERSQVDVAMDAAQKGAWVVVEVEAKDGVISASIPGQKEPLSWQAEWELDGAIGLFISGYTRNPEPIRFRHLKIEG